MPDTNDDEWVVFRGRARTPVTTPIVSIQRKGAFLLTQSAWEALGSPDVVELLWNPRRRQVGFRPTDPESPHAYPVRPMESGKSYMVSGRSFMQQYNIPFDRVRRYPAKLEGAVLVIGLDEPEPVNSMLLGEADDGPIDFAG